MRQSIMIGLAATMCAGWVAVADAREKDLEDLPRDVWDLATAWTQPIQQVARETQRFDPVSGTWFGLLEGSLKSVEQTVAFILPPQHQDQPGSEVKDGKLLFNYGF